MMRFILPLLLVAWVVASTAWTLVPSTGVTFTSGATFKATKTRRVALFASTGATKEREREREVRLRESRERRKEEEAAAMRAKESACTSTSEFMEAPKPETKTKTIVARVADAVKPKPATTPAVPEPVKKSVNKTDEKKRGFFAKLWRVVKKCVAPWRKWENIK